MWDDFWRKVGLAAVSTLMLGLSGSVVTEAIQHEDISLLRSQYAQLEQSEKEILQSQITEREQIASMKAVIQGESERAHDHSPHIRESACACVSKIEPAYAVICDQVPCDETAIKRCEIEHRQTRCMPLK